CGTRVLGGSRFDFGRSAISKEDVMRAPVYWQADVAFAMMGLWRRICLRSRLRLSAQRDRAKQDRCAKSHVDARVENGKLLEAVAHRHRSLLSVGSKNHSVSQGGWREGYFSAADRQWPGAIYSASC